MLALLHAAIGLGLGWSRPLWALAVLVGAVSVTSSLWWQIELSNAAAPFAYASAFVLARGVRRLLARVSRSDGDYATAALVPGGIPLAVTLTVAFTLLATLLAVFRQHAGSIEMLALEMTSKAVFVSAFNPSGPPGELQAALIAAGGPLLLLATIGVLRGEAERMTMHRAFVCGALISVAAPALQFLFLDPWVRPDKGEEISTGLVGFFQDPHSFAAYLLLMIGLAAGIGWGDARTKASRSAIAHALLALVATVVLIGTNSRAGIIALLAGGACWMTIRRLESRSLQGDRRFGRGLLVPAGVLLVVLALGVAIASLPQLRRATYKGLRQIGALRIAQPLEQEADWDQLLGDRRTRWARTFGVIEQRPLWGAGPRSIQALPMGTVQSPITGEVRTIVPENTHNYFLQFAAEYGIPAASALLWLIVASLAIAVRGALNHPVPRLRAVLTGIVAGQVGFVLFSVVSHPMLLAECQAVYWTLSGLAISTAGAPSDR